MRKSKYLILNNFYFNFDDDLTDIINVKKLFKNQNILDLERFNDLKIIEERKFEGHNLNFIYLSINIEEIEWSAFIYNQIEILDLSNCINLKVINETAFKENQIKHLKLPKNIETLSFASFAYNKIQNLDLSNCIKLKEINSNVFYENPLTEIKILNDIDINYSYDDDYKYDLWNRFVKYYNNNNKKSGDYKLENNQWQWYPL